MAWKFPVEESEEEEETNEDEQELEDVKAKINDYNTNIATLLAAVKKLNQEKAAAEKKRDELQKRVNKLENKEAAKQQKSERIKQKIAEIKKASEGLEAQIELVNVELGLKR